MVAAACNLAGSSGPLAGVWALNESTNDYVIRVVSPESALSTATYGQSWAFVANGAGYTTAGRGMSVEVLNAGTCALVAQSPVTRDLLISVDQRGRVQFIPQADRPSIDTELSRTTACERAPAPT